MMFQDTPTLLPRREFVTRTQEPIRDAAATVSAQQIASIIDVFDAHGGLASGEEVSVLLRRHCDQPLSQLARWIVGGDIVCIEWRGQTLIPLFQFDFDHMTIKPAVSAVLAELAGRLSNTQTSCWFATPNVWLNRRRPLENIGADLPAVLEAARAELCAATA